MLIGSHSPSSSRLLRSFRCLYNMNTQKNIYETLIKGNYYQFVPFIFPAKNHGHYRHYFFTSLKPCSFSHWHLCWCCFGMENWWCYSDVVGVGTCSDFVYESGYTIEKQWTLIDGSDRRSTHQWVKFDLNINQITIWMPNHEPRGHGKHKFPPFAKSVAQPPHKKHLWTRQRTMATLDIIYSLLLFLFSFRFMLSHWYLCWCCSGMEKWWYMFRFSIWKWFYYWKTINMNRQIRSKEHSIMGEVGLEHQSDHHQNAHPWTKRSCQTQFSAICQTSCTATPQKMYEINKINPKNHTSK
jgi:hypothetical protein